jgi:NADH:ubiquinone oxidoreductase subunit 5 (subunit L)/multisubunit Na+/H+ antiporter MnhA subunit
MDPESTLPFLLACAWLIPLASFVTILLFGKYMGPGGKFGGYLATLAIVTSAVLSMIAMFGVWIPNYYSGDTAAAVHAEGEHTGGEPASAGGEAEHAAGEADHADAHHNNGPPDYITGDWYTLAEFGSLKLTIGYYIDALTVGMFCMVTIIASCVHFYALGYMHDELHEPFVDHEVTLSNGEHLHRKGRFYRFFQYLSLFCFSMLGIVIAGNVAMVFVFWELVGICSYFLIGFYIERKSASTAANKAFIVNRVGDFGMLIGMMALWSSIGTFNFGDIETKTPDGVQTQPGLFSQLRTEENEYHLAPTESMIVEETRQFGTGEPPVSENAGAGGDADGEQAEPRNTAGQWLLLIAGVGIFCGCVGKSAQFPLHVWLPDAMEGPTPVSALVHSATMVAAGVYLVGRFYPVFSPEALLVIAYTGSITAIIAASIAITATDIKRVLAYSTVSQLGYMMLSLGLGGWVAGIFHLITHAFFKGLLFMCSGSVIHAVHTNDMTYMGGLRKKMPITAYTMLIGCLAIIGAGIPFTVFGFSGYFSKDAIIEQAWSYANHSPQHSLFLKWLPIIGAAVTAFYMFRLWYLTFAGTPRDHHRYEHAHESPRVMTTPLIVLAVFAIAIGWPIFGVYDMLDNARPIGTLATTEGQLWSNVVIPSEHLSHEPDIKQPAAISAITAAGLGVLLSSIVYLWRLLNPDELKQSFQPVHTFLWNKWYFDELYNYIFVKPVMWIAGLAAWFDRGVIDSILHGAAAICRGFSKVVDALFDQTLVDGTVNTFASGTWNFGLWLRRLQTGNLRQYVMFIVVGTVLLFVAITFVQSYLTPTQSL